MDTQLVNNKLAQRLPTVLFLLRISVFLVFLVWSLDKLLNPEHGAQVIEGFYGIGGLGNAVVNILGILQLIIIVAFLLGFVKTYSYGLVFIMHAVSTLASFKQYLNPFEPPNLLFFAAWPMLAACFALFYLRDFDTRWTLDKD